MTLAGFRFIPGYLDRESQREVLAAVRAVIAEAPLYSPRMPRSGKPFSVKMTNCGPLGWVSDIEGYRYQPMHPETGKAWPPIPPIVMQAWETLSGYPHPPEACLVNYYAADTRMGLHQDKDEADFQRRSYRCRSATRRCSGSAARSRSDPTRSFRLSSGDAVVLGGEVPPRLSRRRPHHQRNVRPPCEGGRFNLTLRRVTRRRNRSVGDGRSCRSQVQRSMLRSSVTEARRRRCGHPTRICRRHCRW